MKFFRQPSCVAQVVPWGGVGLALALSVAACATGSGGAATKGDAVASPTVAAPSENYASAPHPGGVLGGPEAARIATRVSEGLAARGDRAEADGALARAAHELGRQAQDGRKADVAVIEAIARRSGFAGVVLWAQVYTIEGEDSAAWRDGLAQLPRNLPINRYGVSVFPDGRVVSVAFASMEAALDPFPRRVAPGSSIKLTGEVAGRFTFARVDVTGVDGRVSETRMPGRKISASLAFKDAGVYKVEVLGDGATGPVVVANVPVYVGVPEPSDTGRTPNGDAGAGATLPVVAAAAVDVADWPEHMLQLLNRARAAEHLNPLKPDAELAAVASAHCRDMVANDFFGHQSPTTGGPDDRVRAAGIAVSTVGENVAQGDTPVAAHELLMDSPAHRANMLGARFTHVGIGVAATKQPGVRVTTLVFGRRPPVAVGQLTAADVTRALASLRAGRGVQAVAVDPALQAAAQAGVAAYATAPGGSAPTQRAFAASESSLREEVKRRPGQINACAKLLEILEPDDLDHYPELATPSIRRVGISVTVNQNARPPRLVVFLVLEGGGCH